MISEEVGRKPVSWPAKCCRGNALTSGTPGSHEQWFLAPHQQNVWDSFSAKARKPTGGLPRPFFMALADRKPAWLSCQERKLLSTKAPTVKIRDFFCSEGDGWRNTGAVQEHCQIFCMGRDPGNPFSHGESCGSKHAERP